LITHHPENQNPDHVSLITSIKFGWFTPLYYQQRLMVHISTTVDINRLS